MGLYPPLICGILGIDEGFDSAVIEKEQVFSRLTVLTSCVNRYMHIIIIICVTTCIRGLLADILFNTGPNGTTCMTFTAYP